MQAIGDLKPWHWLADSEKVARISKKIRSEGNLRGRPREREFGRVRGRVLYKRLLYKMTWPFYAEKPVRYPLRNPRSVCMGLYIVYWGIEPNRSIAVLATVMKNYI